MNTRDNDVLELATEFYDAGSVALAVSGYQEYLSGISVIADRDVRVQITIKPSFDAHDRKRIVREFLNYALDLSLHKRFLDATGHGP
jgi:hypothetical protein